MKFPVKIRNISAPLFLVKKTEKFPIYVSKTTFKIYVNLLLIEKKGQSHYVLIKDFNIFIYNQTLYRDRKRFCRY